MRVAGFFSGIGGLELGFRSGPFETVALCENDPAARAVLEARFGSSSTDFHGDINNMSQLPTGTDLVVGGFPCQDVSSSGQKTGMAGGRSALVAVLLDLVEADRPPWIVLENVPFMLRLKKGQVIRYVVERLANMGYSWAYRTVDSLAFGLPQRRRRVFLVASNTGDPRNVLLAGDAELPARNRPTLADPIGFYWTEGRYSTGITRGAIPPLKAGSTIGIPSPPAVFLPSGRIVKPTIEDAEALQGFVRGWTEPAEAVTRRSIRWRLVGNAVSVPVARWLAQRLLQPGHYDPGSDPERDSRKAWPSAAWGNGSGRVHVSSASTAPLLQPPQALGEVLSGSAPPLSVKATQGFLRRLKAARLWRPDGFEGVLEEHIARLSASE